MVLHVVPTSQKWGEGGGQEGWGHLIWSIRGNVVVNVGNALEE